MTTTSPQKITEQLDEVASTSTLNTFPPSPPRGKRSVICCRKHWSTADEKVIAENATLILNSKIRATRVNILWIVSKSKLLREIAQREGEDMQTDREDEVHEEISCPERHQVLKPDVNNTF